MQLDQPAKQPIIIISASGMASGGRVVRHLAQRLPGAQNTILFVGFQVPGTFGHQLITAKGGIVNVGGDKVKVKATIEFLEDYSAHADYEDILRWLKAFDPRPKKVFLVHGTGEALETLQTHIEKELGWEKNIVIPKYREHIDLD